MVRICIIGASLSEPHTSKVIQQWIFSLYSFYIGDDKAVHSSNAVCTLQVGMVFKDFVYGLLYNFPNLFFSQHKIVTLGHVFVLGVKGIIYSLYKMQTSINFQIQTFLA